MQIGMEVLASSPALQLKQCLVTNLPSQKLNMFQHGYKGVLSLGEGGPGLEITARPNRHLFHWQKCNNTFFRMPSYLQLGDFLRQRLQLQLYVLKKPTKPTTP